MSGTETQVGTPALSGAIHRLKRQAAGFLAAVIALFVALSGLQFHLAQQQSQNRLHGTAMVAGQHVRQTLLVTEQQLSILYRQIQLALAGLHPWSEVRQDLLLNRMAFPETQWQVLNADGTFLAGSEPRVWQMPPVRPDLLEQCLSSHQESRTILADGLGADRTADHAHPALALLRPFASDGPSVRGCIIAWQPLDPLMRQLQPLLPDGQSLSMTLSLEPTSPPLFTLPEAATEPLSLTASPLSVRLPLHLFDRPHADLVLTMTQPWLAALAPFFQISGLYALCVLFFCALGILYVRRSQLGLRREHLGSLTVHRLLHDQQHLIASLPVGIFKVRRSPGGGQQFLYASPLFCQQLGIQEQAVLDNPDVAFAAIHPDDIDHFLHSIQQAVKQMCPLVWEGRLLAYGRVEWVHIQATPDPLAGGDVVWHGVQAVITERKRVDAELQSSQAHLQAIFDQEPECIKLVDSGGRLIQMNPAGLHMIEADSWESVRNLPVLDLIPPEHKAAYQSLHQQVLNGEPAALDFELVGLKGTRRWLSTRAVPMAYQGQRVHMAVTSDITERKMLELDLRRSNDELERFAYVASHDLRQPLRMISSYLSLLSRRLKQRLDGEEQLFLHYAVDGAKRMDRMILDLLVYSRIGRQCSALESVPLDRVMQQAVQNLGSALQEAEAIIHLPPHLPTVLGHESELERLFQNLLGNAVKFRAPHRPCTVTVCCQDQPNEWVISVQDQGIGIAPQDHPRLFQIFQRLVPQQEYDGTGIGLAACRKIIDHHHGRIWVDSQPDVGSTFFISLPKRPPVDPPGPPMTCPDL